MQPRLHRNRVWILPDGAAPRRTSASKARACRVAVERRGRQGRCAAAGGCLWQSLTAPALDSQVIGRSGRRHCPGSVEPRDLSGSGGCRAPVLGLAHHRVEDHQQLAHASLAKLRHDKWTPLPPSQPASTYNRDREAVFSGLGVSPCILLRRRHAALGFPSQHRAQGNPAHDQENPPDRSSGSSDCP